MRRSILMLALILTGVSVSYAADQTSSLAEADLQKFTYEAVKNNPLVASKKNEYRAAQARVLAAWLPEDPEIGIDAEGQPDTFNIDERTNYEYSLEQTVPFPTKLILRGMIASKEAGVLYGRYKEEERNAVRDVAELYFDLLISKKTFEILQSELSIFDQMLRASQGRYETGQTLQEDLLKIDIERKRTEIEIFRLNENARIFEERLSKSLNRPLETKYILIEPQKPKDIISSRESIEQLALKNRPELQAMKKGLEKAGAQAALDRTEWLPDITLRYEGRELRNEDDISEHDTFIGVTVPVWSLLKGIGGTWRAAGHEVNAAKALYEAEKNETYLYAHELYAKLKSAEHALQLYENSIVPASRQHVDASLVSYEAGRGSFLGLIESQRTERQVRLDYYRHLVDYEVARMELQLLDSSKEEA